jgi:hypothetical protein
MEPMNPNLADAIDTAGEYEIPDDAPDTMSAGMPDTYGAAVMTHEPVDQRLAQYRPAIDISSACAMCVHYHADSCACFRVAGPIRPDYVCDLFDPASLADKANQTAVIDGAYIIAKSDDLEQHVFGWANVAVTKSGEQTIDHHLDVIDPEDLELAAYDFVMNARVSGEDHAGDVDATCIESIVFTKEKIDAMGLPEGLLPEAGWWVGFHIPDRDAYERARDSKSMFSIEGTAIREPLEIVKAEYTTDQRNQMAARGEAMADGGYPIATIADLRNAIQAFGRASNPAETKRHIVARARALGRTDLLPAEWSGSTATA